MEEKNVLTISAEEEAKCFYEFNYEDENKNVTTHKVDIYETFFKLISNKILTKEELENKEFAKDKQRCLEIVNQFIELAGLPKLFSKNAKMRIMLNLFNELKGPKFEETINLLKKGFQPVTG